MGLKKDLDQVNKESPWLAWVLLLVFLVILGCLVLDQLQLFFHKPDLSWVKTVNWSEITEIRN